MSMIDQLLSFFVPHECFGCGVEGMLLCKACREVYLQPIPERCFHCHAVSRDSRLCERCRRKSALHAVHACVTYEDYAKSLVGSLKFEGAQAAAKEMAAHMQPYIHPTAPAPYIVPVPTATSRVRKRGYDQAVLLAKELSRQTGVPYRKVLRRHGQTHQVGSSRSTRLEQLRTAFTTINPASVMAVERIILVDDVTTTGATLEAAARTLRQAGVKRIDALVFAQA